MCERGRNEHVHACLIDFVSGQTVKIRANVT
jgi:hypothetical protein